MSKKIYIVIAAYNEEKIIKEVITEIKSAGYKNIIVVDDGSSDKTFEKAKEAKTIVLRHIINRGKGAAVKTGIEAAKILNADLVITLDGDGQHNPQNIKEMIRKIDKEKYDVVLGTRLMDHRGMPFQRVIANYIGNFVTWMCYGFWVSDSQSGFRAYSKKAFSLIDTKHDRYEYDSEIIKEIVKHKLKCIEIPITVRYTQYSKSKKDKQSLSNGLKTLFRMTFSS